MTNLILLVMTALLNNTPLTVKSPAFSSNDFIPQKYSCLGTEISPELAIMDIPEKTKTLALIMDDPDAPKGGFDHWIMWNIPPTGVIKENSTPGKQGKNGKHENKYAGPCPPSGTHHYHFKVYALDKELDLTEATDKKALEKAMEGHVLAKGELIGLFGK